MKKFYCSMYVLLYSLFLAILSTNSSLLCKCNDHHNCLDHTQSQSKNVTERYCKIELKGDCYSSREVVLKPVPQILHRFGCLSKTKESSILSCNGHYTNRMPPTAINCCNKTNFCNSYLQPKFYHYETDKEAINAAVNYFHRMSTTTGFLENNNLSNTKIILMVITLLVSLVSVILIVILIIYCRKKIKWHIRASKQILRQTPNNNLVRHSEERELKIEDCTDAALLTVNNSKTASNSLMTASSVITNSTSIPLTGLSQQRLTQRTVGHQILFREFLGKGRFSEVWSGEWLGEMVAVKFLSTYGLMSTLDEKLWLRTIGIYYSCPLRHNDVVGLLGSDRIALTNRTDVLIDQCHPDILTNYSLRPALIYPYFQWGTLSRLMSSSHWDLDTVTGDANNINRSRLETLSKMAFSLAAGLCYIHTEIAATKGKPAMAHRNLKTTNIYVKDDYTCCIGDFEWAIVACTKTDISSNGSSHLVAQPSIPKGLVQTPDFEYCIQNILFSTGCRYVAPELLEAWNNKLTNQSTSLKSVDDYKKADVYSLSLILWEMLVWFEPSLKVTQCCSLQVQSDSPMSHWLYEPAYQSELIKFRQTQGCDSSLLFEEPRPSEMYNLVVSESIRPVIKNQNQSDLDPVCSTDSLLVQPSAMAIINFLCYIIPQCWCSYPDSRLSSLKIKKYLSQLQEPVNMTSNI